VLKELAQYLVQLSEQRSESFDYGSLRYSNKSVSPLMWPVPQAVRVNTLQGFVDLAQSAIEDFQASAVVAQVRSHAEAVLIGKVSDSVGRRQEYIIANLPDVKGFPFNNFYDTETFTIGLLSQFTPNAGDHDYVVRLSSNVVSGTIRTAEDDGVSQQVTVKGGAALKGETTVRSRVRLAPFRTFREVEQPVSEFVLRAKNVGDGQVQLGLFEADGGKWKIDAVENVARWLRVALDKVAITVVA
jgi:hypothetical protein